MTYQETLDYLFSQLPMYQRIGKAAYKVDLDNTLKLCNHLSNPENKFKSVHIAGTNGKGSTSHMIASVLQEAGYKVGLYTSPHLKDFRERVKINGKMISEDRVCRFVEQHKIAFEKINLSFFEWTVGLAFDYFSKEKVDIAIIETGLGGRLDSTNVITPLVSVITNIGLDHTQFLGDSLVSIAKEKAGIIKEKIPVIIGETQSEIESIFQKKAQLKNSKLSFADQFESPLYNSDLKGIYQRKNIRTAHATLQILKKHYEFSAINISNGLNNVVLNTGLLGRWQTLSSAPLTICDTAHNLEGIKYIVKQIKSIKYNKLRIVLGMVNDKSIEKVLALLPKDGTYYFCKPNIPRGLDAEELSRKSIDYNLVGQIYPSVMAAYTAAKSQSTTNDFIYIGGSTFVVAEVI